MKVKQLIDESIDRIQSRYYKSQNELEEIMRTYKKNNSQVRPPIYHFFKRIEFNRKCDHEINRIYKEKLAKGICFFCDSEKLETKVKVEITGGSYTESNTLPYDEHTLGCEYIECLSCNQILNITFKNID